MSKQKSPLTELRFPAGGLSRRAGFDQQPPYTTPYCYNVRPYDVVPGTGSLTPGQLGYQQRQRGGARPGIVKTYAAASQPQAGKPFQLLDFAGILPASGNVTNTLIGIVDGVLYYSTGGGMAAVAGSSFNASANYLQGTQVGNLYYVADYKPVNWYGAGTGTINSGGLTLTDAALSGYTAATGDVIWISPADATQENLFPVVSVSGTTVTFTNSVGNTLTPQSGVTWQINRMPQVFDPVGLTVSNLTTTPIAPTQCQTGTVSCTSGVVTLSGGSFPTFTSAQLAGGVVFTIPNASGIGTQSYLVAAQQSSTHLTLTDSTSDANCSGVTSPNWNVAWTGTYFGVPPLGCSLCCTYRGRLVLAGGAWGPLWYMSRILTPTDWDYGYDPNDPSRAVAGESATTGGIPDNLTALIPHSDQYLLFGCAESLWLLTADPAYGGQIVALSRDIGVLGPGAWCSLPDMSTVILSRDGLYLIPAGASGYPQPISRPNLPAELVDVDWQANRISMAYDVQARGLHLSITPI